jgi:branched-chain amino acid transport system ATP-binding protein
VSEPVLDVRGVGIRFGGLRALTEFSLQVSSGDVVGLIGPNGAGKTTAFNLLTGVYVPDEGEVRVCGERVDGKKPHEVCRQGMARTFQNIRLFKQLSVLDNVKVACGVQCGAPLFAGSGKLARAFSNYYDWWRALLLTPGFTRNEALVEERARQLLEVMGLSKRADEQADTLPYGEQRRLEIARALGAGPKVLLLDEPAAGMNPKEKVELMELILGLTSRFSLGVLLIEHDMKLVMGICKRITVLDHGETIASGTPESVRSDRAVIAAYLGDESARRAASAEVAAGALPPKER